MKKHLLIGRERELALLSDFVVTAAGGLTCVGAITGEPGVGKTRLLSEAASQASEDGAIVLRGGASESAGMPPYLLFLEALGPYVRTSSVKQLRDQAGDQAADLVELFPDVATRLGKLSPAYPLPAEQARFRMYEAVSQFLAAIAQSHLTLLVFDDLQWADPASLDLLCHIVRRRLSGRLLILVAYREGEAASNSALARAIAHLNRTRLLHVITLAPLGDEAIAALGASYLGGPLDLPVVSLLQRHSEGNPFFAEELLQGWLEAGAVALTAGRWTLTPSFEPSRIPPGVIGAVQQRLSRLPVDVVGHLQSAAIIGRSFDVFVLAAVDGQPVEVIEERLVTACRTNIVRADASGTYAFTHDKIREGLYALVPTSRRRRLHDAVGRILETQIGEDNPQQLSDLAFHFARGTDRSTGVTYSLRAAESALRTHAAAEALEHFRTARELAHNNDERFGEILLGLGRAAVFADALTQAVSAFEAGRAWGRQKRDRLTTARAASGLGIVYDRSGGFERAAAAFEDAVVLLEDSSGAQLAHALADLASVEAFMGSYELALDHARRALTVARDSEDRLLETKTLRAIGKILFRLNDTAAAMQALEEALAIATAVDDPVEMGDCCYRLAHASFFSAALCRCRSLALAWLDHAHRCRDRYQVLKARLWIASVAVAEGNWTDAERLIAEDMLEVERGGYAELLDTYRLINGHAAYRQGHYQRATEQFTALDASLAKHPQARGRSVQGMLGLVQLATGKRREALEWVVAQEALLATLPAGSTPTATMLVALAEVALRVDDGERLNRYYASLLPFEGQFYDFLVDRLLGVIEIRRGDWSAAEAHLDAAEATARREGIRPELGPVFEARADFELARRGGGSVIRARRRLGEASRVYQGLRMVADVSRVRARLRSLPTTHEGSPVHRLNTAGLSAREIEVLRLVTRGLSNRRIAYQLALSERTVANHVASILNKTAAENRAAAAVFAIRHGLT